MVPEFDGTNVAIPRKYRDVNELIRWAEKWKSPITHGKREGKLDKIRKISETLYYKRMLRSVSYYFDSFAGISALQC